MPAGNFAPPFVPPGYPGTYPGQAAVPQALPQSYPMQQQFAPQSAPAYAAAPQQAAPWNAGGIQPSNPRPVFRGQADDDPAPQRRAVSNPRPAPLSMPSPEALGLAEEHAQSRPIDWTAVHGRLDQLGARCFQLDRPTPGVFRITCLLPTNQPGRTHRIEAQAGSETEVIRLTLAEAEEWAGRR